MSVEPQDLVQNQEHIYNKETPYLTKVLVNYKLNKAGSIKDTRHIEIDLKDSGIYYKPGDSLCIFPENDPALVDKFLGLVELVKPRDQEFERFLKEVNITRPSSKFFKLVIEKIADDSLDAKAMQEKYNGYTIPAIIEHLKLQHPSLTLSTDDIANNLPKLNARAYSIASSQSMHPDQVDLCISRVDEEINGQKVLGVCSNYISDRVTLNENSVHIYVEENNKFRLPKDQSKDIIMIGPGTGIAPFRSFIEERKFLKDKGHNVGRNWLFFGDQKHAFDYLYGEELEQYKQDMGLKVSLAFSRDQEEKIYVQTRMKEHGNDIFDWLETGAYFYVCGDARRMARDVDTALREIITEHGKDADAYMKDLKDSGRYCRDVY